MCCTGVDAGHDLEAGLDAGSRHGVEHDRPPGVVADRRHGRDGVAGRAQPAQVDCDVQPDAAGALEVAVVVAVDPAVGRADEPHARAAVSAVTCSGVARPSRMRLVPTIAPSATASSGARVAGVEPAADEHGAAARSVPRGPHLVRRGRLARARARDHDGIRSGLAGAARRFGERSRGEHLRVLDLDVREHEHVLGADRGAIGDHLLRRDAHRAVLGTAHLVGEVVGADEVGAGRERDRQRCLGIVEQDLDADRQRARGPHELARHGRHDRDRLASGLDAVRLVVLVLDEDAVELADAIRRELCQRVRHDGRQAGRAGIAGQRGEVDHADQRLRGREALSEAGHAAWYAVGSHVRRRHALRPDRRRRARPRGRTAHGARRPRGRSRRPARQHDRQRRDDLRPRGRARTRRRPARPADRPSAHAHQRRRGSSVRVRRTSAASTRTGASPASGSRA